MNILIDGCILAELDQGSVREFWRASIPRLPSLLPGHIIYLLNREPDARLPAVPGLRNLNAPAPEWAHPALEDRRLAALCQELGIDVFVSTCGTSAGGQVRSLFVSTEALTGSQEDTQKEALASESARRANGLATWRWTAPNGVKDVINLTEQLAEALIHAGTCEMPLDAQILRAAEEELTARQANELREAELRRFIAADQAYHEGLAHRAQSPQGVVRRLYWALRQPYRYREYAIRMLEGLGLRRG
jgi:hypothetical protein